MVKFSMRVKSNGVPIIRKVYMDQIAEKILLEYDKTLLEEPKRLDIEHFAECYMGLDTDYQDLSHDQSILGMMVFNDGYIPVYDAEKNKAKRIKVHKKTILIDCSLLEDDQVRRGRFTHTHEVAHWFLHKHIYHNDKYKGTSIVEGDNIGIRCRSVNVDVNENREYGTDDDWMEWQANYLASALLMPKKVFSDLTIELFEKAGFEKDEKSFKKFCYADDIAILLSEVFDVSITAAKIRMKNLDLI